MHHYKNTNKKNLIRNEAGLNTLLASLVYLLIALICFKKIYKKMEEEEDKKKFKSDFWRKNCEKMELISTNQQKTRNRGL